MLQYVSIEFSVYFSMGLSGLGGWLNVGICCKRVQATVFCFTIGAYKEAHQII